MSRSFIGFGQADYIGVPFTRAINYKGQTGKQVVLTFPWAAYGASTANPNINVLVDMQTAAVQQGMQVIRSVYIDNMGSDVPVYVYCPDTTYTVVAEPNSAGWFRLYTNALVLWVIGQGFVTGDIPTTSIYVTNIEVENFIDIEIAQAQTLYKASNKITRGTSIYQANFGVPALGDQFLNASLAMNMPVQTAVLFGGPQPNGFWYINNIAISFMSTEFNNLNVDRLILFEIVSTGISGVLVSANSSYVSLLAPFAGSVTYFQYTAPNPVLNMMGMNIKLDATQQWLFRVTPVGSPITATSIAQLNMCFTFNPS